MNESKKRYTFQVTPINEEDGGGYIINYPSFRGFTAYGETLEETIVKGERGLQRWIDSLLVEIKKDQCEEPKSFYPHV